MWCKRYDDRLMGACEAKSAGNSYDEKMVRACDVSSAGNTFGEPAAHVIAGVRQQVMH